MHEIGRVQTGADGGGGGGEGGGGTLAGVCAGKAHLTAEAGHVELIEGDIHQDSIAVE